MKLSTENKTNKQQLLYKGFSSKKPLNKKNAKAKKNELESVFDKNGTPEYWGSGF